MTEVYEATTATVTITFTDENSDPVIPTSGLFVLYDKFSGTIKREGALENLAASIDFELTESDTAILNQTNKYEILNLEIQFEFDSKIGRGLYQLKVINLSACVPV